MDSNVIPSDEEQKRLHEMRRASEAFSLEQEDDDESGHHVLRRERELLELVRQGNVSQMLENRKNNVFVPYSQFIDFSKEKTEEYTSVLTVSIASRTAIEAGLTSEECFQLSALYLRKIAQVRSDITEYERLRWDALVAFTQLVESHRRSEKTGNYIEECKQFIATNILRKISVKDAANALNLNPIYLERIFKQSEGITVGDYIQKEKVEKAKNLLKYSDRSQIEISDYLGFSSQSYFGKIFKKETGMTPRQYQMENKMSRY